MESSASSSRQSAFASSLADLEAGLGEENNNKKKNSNKKQENTDEGKTVEKTKNKERTTQEEASSGSIGDEGDEEKNKAVFYRSVKSHVRHVEEKRLEAMKLQEEKKAEVEKDRQTRRRSTRLLDQKKSPGRKESLSSLSPPLSSSSSPLSSSQKDLPRSPTDSSARLALGVGAPPERGESERRKSRKDSSSPGGPSHQLSPARGEETEQKRNKRSSSPVPPSSSEVIVFERREDFNESSLSSSISDQDVKSSDEIAKQKTSVSATAPPPVQPGSVQTGERKEEIQRERGRPRERSTEEVSSRSEGREREDLHESKERDGRFKRFNSQVWFATDTPVKNDEGHEKERKRLSSSASPPSSGVHTPSCDEGGHRPSSSPPHTVAIEMGDMQDDDQGRAKEQQQRLLRQSTSNVSSESRGRKHGVSLLSHSASVLTTADSQVSRIRRGRDEDGRDLGGSEERGENKTRRGRTSQSPGGSPSSPTSLRDQQSTQKGDNRGPLRGTGSERGGANGGWEMSLRRWYLGGGAEKLFTNPFLDKKSPNPTRGRLLITYTSSAVLILVFLQE